MVRGRARAWRNAALAAATTIVAGLLFVYPTSTTGGLRATPPALAPAGIVGASPDLGAGGEPAGGHDDHLSFDGAPKPQLVNGPAVQTAYGPVQVQVQVIEGFILEATALAYPQASLVDKAINAEAIPRLEKATLDAQSAGIDTISGATDTSVGYQQSLQAALDAADF